MCVSYLEEGSVAAQTCRAEGAHRAQTAPEVDARQQGAGGEEEARGGLDTGHTHTVSLCEMSS